MLFTNFSEFKNHLNEERILLKRQYGEKKAEYINSSSIMRHRILEFIENKGKVTKTELMEFLNGLEESEGKRPSKSFLLNNKHLIEKLSKNGEDFYRLTSRGKKTYNTFKKFEADDDLDLDLDDEEDDEEETDDTDLDIDTDDEKETDDVEGEKDPEDSDDAVTVDDVEDDTDSVDTENEPEIDLKSKDDEDEDEEDGEEDNDVKIEVNVNK